MIGYMFYKQSLLNQLHTNVADKERSLKLMTWNVQGLNHPNKRKKVITFIKSKRCDIAFLQETHLLTQESRKLCRDWVGHVSASCWNSHSRGVAILVHKQMQLKCIKESTDAAGRDMLLLAEIQGHKVILANANVLLILMIPLSLGN